MTGDHHHRRESYSGPFTAPWQENDRPDGDLIPPFGKLEGLDHNDIRETAYEIFFTSCRSSPGFGGKNPLTFYSSSQENGDGGPISPKSGGRRGGVGLISPSKTKRALGLKVLRRSLSKKASASHGGSGSAPSSPDAHQQAGKSSAFGLASPGISLTVPQGRPRRPLTSAEIMRQQMRITEQSDARLRKTLMRALVGQTGRRPDTVILPLELLRHIKPSEFIDTHEYHSWQKRHLKILETGLLLHADHSNTFAVRLRDIIRSADAKPLDTGKNSDTMRVLCNAAVALAWRTADGGAPSDACHWADGHPLNVHLYCALLLAVFDARDDTLVLDEVDDLLDLMRKTWSTLGLNRQIHCVCFTWILFQQYVTTSQIEPDLLAASLSVLAEVSADAKRPDCGPLYVKILSGVLSSMQGWAEKKLLSYHDYYQKGATCVIENLLSLALSASKILGDDVSFTGQSTVADTSGDRVDGYIRSSVRNAFNKISNSRTTREKSEEPSEATMQLAQETEDLAMKERECFSPIFKKWYSMSAGVAAVTLHDCYGDELRRYLGGVETLTAETVDVLQRAGRLENTLVQMVVEDTVDSEDGGKGIVREMVDSVVADMLKRWIEIRLKRGKDFLSRSKETETWNPKSKTEPYAQSAVEITKMANDDVDDFFQIPTEITNDLVQDLADGLDHLFGEYISFVSSCGSKQNYNPTLPPLTRCNRDSKFYKLWKKATPCSVVLDDMHGNTIAPEGQHLRPLTSRGTQRLYIRLNTLHYLLTQLHDLGKALAAPRGGRRHGTAPAYFDNCRAAMQTACHHVAEVAAYRLVFLDSSAVFYDSLYAGGNIPGARIRPALKAIKQNVSLLTAMVVGERAQGAAVREVMKACFECFLMVLLAGGPSRVFQRSDHEAIEEDFRSLKRVFAVSGEGLVAEEVVEREAEAVEGVVALMGQSTEQLMEEFSIVACETSGMGVSSPGQKLPMPPTTGKWSRTDPNTILRVLCHRSDRVANQFLKRTFHLAKRSGIRGCKC